MMDARAFLEAFAKAHVLVDFRERFVHEALKKPAKLQSRICHSIGEVFSDHYRDGVLPFKDDEICIPITGSGVQSFEEYRWSEVEASALRGLGLLVASGDGRKFYAETDSEHGSPTISYSSAR